MKVNKTYRSLLDKSIASMLSAIEIYNKPNFGYREETFAILAVNAWELLLKAYLLRINKYKLNSIYILEFVRKKDGTPSNRKKPVLNNCGNPKTIAISEAIKRLGQINVIHKNLTDSIESIIELRDNAVHFVNEKTIVKEIQELGFACIKNYMSVIKKWNLEIELSEYNFYLMPLAYVDSKVYAESVTTSETKNYLDFIKNKIRNKDISDDDFDIAISIDIFFKKTNSFDALGVTYDKDGVGITMTEENIRDRYPLTHKNVIERCKSRYSDFKQDRNFNANMKQIKSDKALHHIRKLDPENKKSIVKPFYSSNIWQVLDKHYTKNRQNAS